jgi:hypothetical protein
MNFFFQFSISRNQDFSPSGTFCIRNSRAPQTMPKVCKPSKLCVHEKIRNKCPECKDSKYVKSSPSQPITQTLYLNLHLIPSSTIESRYLPPVGFANMVDDATSAGYSYSPSNHKDCGGKGMCTHGRRKGQCKECGGSSICIHGRIKYNCLDCGSGMNG